MIRLQGKILGEENNMTYTKSSEVAGIFMDGSETEAWGRSYPDVCKIS